MKQTTREAAMKIEWREGNMPVAVGLHHVPDEDDDKEKDTVDGDDANG